MKIETIDSSAMASGSRSSNFGTDDVLCSCDDCAPQGSSGSMRSDPPSIEFQDNRMSRPLVNIYEQDEHRNSTDNFTSIVERCMKNYADTLMRSLDGISGRLAQLEMHCYKVEQSVGELRGDMLQGQSQTDGKFKSLEKHMQEVHRAVQILRDKQELADMPKELSKLQMLQKECTEQARTPTPVQESTKHEDSPKQKQIPNLKQVNLPQSQLPQLPLQQDGNNNSPYVANHAIASGQSLPAAPSGYQYVQTRPQLQEIPPVQPQIVQQMEPKPAPFPQYNSGPHKTKDPSVPFRPKRRGLGLNMAMKMDEGNGAMTFDLEYARWLEDQNKQINEMRAAVNAHAGDTELRGIVEGIMAHYDEIFRLKGVAAKADVFHVLSGMWKTPAERCFLWLGGFRSSKLLKLLSGQLEPLTDQQVMGLHSLAQSSQQAEDALSQGMEALQQSLAVNLAASLGPAGASGNVANYMEQMAMAMDKLGTLEIFLRQADNLRQETLHQMVRILTTRQSARALLAVHDYFSRLRAVSSVWLARLRE